MLGLLSPLPWRRWLTATIAATAATAALQACVLYDQEGPTSTQLYALIDAHCRSATECGCGFAGPDPDTCVPELEARWKVRAEQAQQRGLRYDAACLAGLTAEIESYGCYWPGGPSPLCENFCAVFHGDRAEGDACEGDDPLASDCAQGLTCQDGTCVPPCAALLGRGQGEPCGNELWGQYDDCAPGLWCSWSGQCEPTAELDQPCLDSECGPGLHCYWQTGTCVAAPTEGQRCDELPCAEGLSCRWENDQSRCLPLAAEGESCSERSCAEGLWCDSSERCATAPGAGQPCLRGSICDDDSTCDFEVGVCLARPEAGAPCALGSCARGAWCDLSVDPEGLCMPPQPLGGACAGHSQCESRYCPNGFCGSPPQEGESCEATRVCAPGLVCNGTTCETTLTRAPAACSYPGW